MLCAASCSFNLASFRSSAVFSSLRRPCQRYRREILHALTLLLVATTRTTSCNSSTAFFFASFVIPGILITNRPTQPIQRQCMRYHVRVWNVFKHTSLHSKRSEAKFIKNAAFQCDALAACATCLIQLLHAILGVAVPFISEILKLLGRCKISPRYLSMNARTMRSITEKSITKCVCDGSYSAFRSSCSVSFDFARLLFVRLAH